MSWQKVKLKEVLKQYRVQHIVQDTTEYKQVSILNDGSVVLRGSKIGKEIGRKRQFIIDLNTYPDTLIFTRQLLLQGSIGIASEDVNNCIVTENMPMFSIQTSKIDKDFLILFLKSEVFKSRIRKIELSGSAQKSIHERTFLDLEFYIPKIEEQKEIVGELLKLKSHSNSISIEITHQLDLIKQLRQAFLREAMQGKLCHAELVSASQETGHDLLAKIKAEKAQLIAEKKLKKEKELPPITVDEIPFEIPEHWAWCRLGEIISYTENLDIHKKLTSDTEINYVDIASIDNKEYIIKEIKKSKVSELSTRARRVLKKGYIIYSTVRPYLKNIAIINQDLPNFIGSTGFNVFKPIVSDVNFLFYFLLTPDLNKRYEEMMVGFNSPSITNEQFENTLFPLPPLHEQEQIVAKLEELMAFCDGLEESIKESQGYNEKLLQQVLREALQGKDETKVITLSNKVLDNSLKTILAGHIVNVCNTKDFGRVKFQKILFLTEYYCKINFESNYFQKTAGPYDGGLINQIEDYFKKFSFFKVDQDKSDLRKVKYVPMSGAEEINTMFLEHFNNESLKINNLLMKLRTLNWEECEVIATIYAVWNNRIIKNQLISDDEIYQDFLDWSERKESLIHLFHKKLFWMKEENIIPDGWGKYVDISN
jgi:type I restriction enzyme S subunit